MYIYVYVCIYIHMYMVSMYEPTQPFRCLAEPTSHWHLEGRTAPVAAESMLGSSARLGCASGVGPGSETNGAVQKGKWLKMMRFIVAI